MPNEVLRKERAMERINKSWMAVAAATLLVATLVGVVWARPNDRPQAQEATRKVTLTGSEFTPRSEVYDWGTNGAYVQCNSGNCQFFAPVVFPCLPGVIVERILLHVTDNNGSARASATLYRAHPPTKGDVYLGKAQSPTGTAGHQPWSSNPINHPVWPSQRAYIFLVIEGPGIEVYGVTVEYHRNI
jgi:hypothetical protein